MISAPVPEAGERGGDALPSRRVLQTAMLPFQSSLLVRSLWQFGSTFLIYVSLQILMYGSLHVGVWLTLLLSVPAAGLLIRLFIIQHDCGHGSFLKTRRANDGLGRFCSLLTFTPYSFWRRQHANHHAHFNNLDRRDAGIDIYSTCVTVSEYRALSRWGQLRFRILRHPILTQIVLPPVVFLLLYRIPFDAPASWIRERRGVWLTNLIVFGMLTALVFCTGIRAVLLVQLPIMVFASIIGMWLFSVQHRFEETHWARQTDWDPIQASLRGSSFLKLPRVLQWFTGNIGFHHIHHLAARIPNYRLQECHESNPELGVVPTLTLWQALVAPCYVLWDEEQDCMVRCR